MITNINHLPYATRTGARVILAKGRQAVGQGHEVKEIAEFNGEISENNGFNCTQAESPCLTRKVGVLKMKKDASGPLYVNLVAIVGPKNRPAGPGDHVKVSPGGRDDGDPLPAGALRLTGCRGSGPAARLRGGAHDEHLGVLRLVLP